jgi:hypothetical protein
MNEIKISLQYLVCRRNDDHAMAAEFAASIVGYWQQQGNDVEREKWSTVVASHQEKVT